MTLNLSLDFTRLRHAYAHQGLTPMALVEEVYRRIALRGEDHVWLHLEPRERVLSRAATLYQRYVAGEDLPLYGLPYGVKDNIDVAGVPTTSACSGFSHIAVEDAAVVQRLDAAGALFIGKQNMDQFATGLVGVRNIGGSCRNAFNPDYIPGGSSSGSAVAVAAGLVAFSIGSDTGGSGRIPAACNNVVGLKPTPGLVSTHGFIYCNRSFDVAPVFALTVNDAYQVLDVLAGPDSRDLYSVDRALVSPGDRLESFRFAIVGEDQLEFFGDEQARRQFQRTVALMSDLGGTAYTIDFSAFLEAGKMLFDSPLLAERLLTYADTLARAPESVHPAVRLVLEKGAQYDATQTYATLYRLRELRRDTHLLLQGFDALLLPTYARLPTCSEVEADPLQVNTRMGYYTYFANPLQLSAISVPVALRDDGLPFGVSLLGLPFHDLRLRQLAATLQLRAGGTLGATGVSQPASA